jgi:hypothetical protein
MTHGRSSGSGRGPTGSSSRVVACIVVVEAAIVAECTDG